MKRIAILAFFGLALVTGCARHYTITLTNGNRITAVGKPKLEGNDYVYKDAKGGQQARIPAGRVREIDPVSMTGSRQGSGFKAEPTE